MEGLPVLLDLDEVAEERFKEFFGVSWVIAMAGGHVYNAMDGCHALGISAAEMDGVWAKCGATNNRVDLGGGLVGSGRCLRWLNSRPWAGRSVALQLGQHDAQLPIRSC